MGFYLSFWDKITQSTFKLSNLKISFLFNREHETFNQALQNRIVFVVPYCAQDMKVF